MTKQFLDPKAYLQGVTAFLRGRLDNPFDPYLQFEANREWQRGFDNAYLENQNRET